MPVVAVVNRKGGSGKSTLATHLAAYCARAGHTVMLGDVDRQQSAQTWLRLRQASEPTVRGAIYGWTIDARNVFRAPTGTTHVILDTPGGMRGLDLARIVMSADVILMPVCNSVFDRESAAQCAAELQPHPRIAGGRCKFAAVGMRLSASAQGRLKLGAWARDVRVPLIGMLRDSPDYMAWSELGLTLFDQPADVVQADLAEWQPILDWLAPAIGVAKAAPQAKDSVHDNVHPIRPLHAKPPTLKLVVSPAPAREAPADRSEPEPQADEVAPKSGVLRNVLGTLQIPRFLRRGV
jgi:chromosome partitioning protein